MRSQKETSAASAESPCSRIPVARRKSSAQTDAATPGGTGTWTSSTARQITASRVRTARRSSQLTATPTGNTVSIRVMRRTGSMDKQNEVDF